MKKYQFPRFPLMLLFAGLLVLFSSCHKDPPPGPGWVYDPSPREYPIPSGFPEMKGPERNPCTEEGFALGRMLYYDNILSTTGASCSSCHFQELAFCSPARGPIGMDILPHVNLGWKKQFGWTGSAPFLDDVALADLEEDNIFLHANGDSILNRLKRSPDYKKRFGEAFGIDITSVPKETRNQYISFALAQFMRSLISGDSKADKFIRHDAGVSFSQSEFNGYITFHTEKGDCFHCHGYPTFADDNFHNNGLQSTFSGNDEGLFHETGNPADMGKFMSPTLRNIALTAPYMHDGRFGTLEEVVEHYSSGIQLSETIDPLITKGGRRGLNLTSQEKADLVAFLHTLTDSTFITNPEYSNPF